MNYLNFFVRYHYLYNCKNYIISKCLITNSNVIPNVIGTFILFDFFNGLAIWKRRFFVIYLLLLFIYLFFFEFINWSSLRNCKKKLKIINVYFLFIGGMVSNVKKLFELFIKIICCYSLVRAFNIDRAVSKPNVYRLSIDFFFDIFIIKYFIFFIFFFFRISKLFNFYIFIIFNNYNHSISKDIIRLLNFKN